MKKEIHPEYVEAKVICSCGNIIQTRATKPELHIEICSSCHPFFTGKQKFVDAAGRVERFENRLKKHQQLKSAVQKEKKQTLVPLQAKPQIDKPEAKQAE